MNMLCICIPQAGSNNFTCVNPKVSAVTLAGPSYSETVSCSVPASVAAANYSVWVCLPPYGCSYSATNISIAMTVTGATPLSGSAAGGLNVIITVSVCLTSTLGQQSSATWWHA